MALMKDGLAAAAVADISGERHGAPLRSGATLPSAGLRLQLRRQRLDPGSERRLDARGRLGFHPEDALARHLSVLHRRCESRGMLPRAMGLRAVAAEHLRARGLLVRAPHVDDHVILGGGRATVLYPASSLSDGFVVHCSMKRYAWDVLVARNSCPVTVTLCERGAPLCVQAKESAAHKETKS